MCSACAATDCYFHSLPALMRFLTYSCMSDTPTWLHRSRFCRYIYYFHQTSCTKEKQTWTWNILFRDTSPRKPGKQGMWWRSLKSQAYLRDHSPIKHNIFIKYKQVWANLISDAHGIFICKQVRVGKLDKVQNKRQSIAKGKHSGNNKQHDGGWLFTSLLEVIMINFLIKLYCSAEFSFG